MAHGATSSGKYYNGCTEADVNKGCYGKLSSDQLRERIELHARRKIEGKPTVVEIASHWMEKYGVEMSYQSEKKWVATPKNNEMIDARAEELKHSGKVVAPVADTQTLLNSLAETAKASAENCRILKSRMHVLMKNDCTPWGILGITEKEYDKASSLQKVKLDTRSRMLLKARKDTLDMVTAYSRAHISMSKELREGVKQTYEMAKYLGITEAKGQRLRLNQETQAEIEEVKAGETIEGAKLADIDVDKARAEFGYESN